MNPLSNTENRSADGPTLRDLLDEGLLPISLALEIARQILRLLGSEQGSTQHDISPESLILTRDSAGAPRVQPIDLGTAPSTEESPASDIHSFGVLLYELLTGIHPFAGQAVDARPGQPSLSPLGFEVSDPAGRVPPDLRALVLSAIAEDPEGRFGSAEEMDAELARIQTRFPLDASPTIALGSLPPRASWIAPPAPRSPALRSPAQPGMGTRRRPGRLRLSTRLGASVVLALLLLVLLTGFRFLLKRQDESRTVASEPAGKNVAPTVSETMPDAQRVRREPLAGPADPRRVAPDPVIQQPARKPAHRKGRSARPAPSPERRQAPGTRKILVLEGRDFLASEPAVLRSLPAASYPEAALGTGTRAEVVVGVTIDETGAVRDPTIERARIQGSAPEAVFREAALAAARRARFEPARERGVPVRSTSTLTFTFGMSQ